MGKPFVVTFGGMPRTGKTPIAFHLSYTFSLPIIQTNAIRMEVREDLGLHDSSDPRVRKEFVQHLYAADHSVSRDQLDEYYADHQAFPSKLRPRCRATHN